MADETPVLGMQGPRFETAVDEVVALFADHAQFEDAIAKLTLAGFDRADFSLPPDNTEAVTPETGATVNTDIDRQQVRTLATGTAAATAAIGAVGLTVATGGAALVGLAAAAIGGGAAAAAASNAIGQGVQGYAEGTREAAAASGELRLAVHAGTPEKLALAETALRDAGGLNVVRQHRPV